MAETEGPTGEYRRLTENEGAAIRAMTDVELLRHYELTRLMIETDSMMPTNRVRMEFVRQVSILEQMEILRRMSAGKENGRE